MISIIASDNGTTTTNIEGATTATTTAQVTGGIAAASQQDTAEYTNTKTLDIDTGISLDTVPYIMIMALAFAGIVVLMSKKRREQN